MLDHSFPTHSHQNVYAEYQNFITHPDPPVQTPMVYDLKLQWLTDTLSKHERITLSSLPYRPSIGSMMYIVIAIRPDIAYSTGKLAQLFDCHRHEH